MEKNENQIQPIVLVGYGKMGHVLEETAPAEFAITERINSSQELQKCDLQGKIAIDFSTPSAFVEHYKYLADHCAGVVVGTTGWQKQKEEVVDYFNRSNAPMIYANNFSLGVNIYLQLIKRVSCWTAKLLNAQPYLLEMHHRTKLDRPSGTAVQLSKIIGEYYEGADKEMEIASLRVAEAKGMHQVGFESSIERLTFAHEAFSRSGFAMGAWYAAKRLGTVVGAVAFGTLLADIWSDSSL